MPKIDLHTVREQSGSDYPAPHDGPVAARRYRKLSPAAGLADFEANLVSLDPGIWSSQRHWHEGEDELLVMLSGSAELVDDAGRTALGPGDCAAFPKNDGNGHHLIGGPQGCRFLVVGVAETTPCRYPDIDMMFDPLTGAYRHADGTPW